MVNTAPRRVLMVAFHFPPQRGSSGIQRTLKFVQYLPALGWQPLVLTAHPRAHADTVPGPVALPAGLVVRRAFALDTARHLAIKGRYTRLLALPDRWVTWCLGALPAGLALARRYRPQVLWSTYPIASAHLIGLALHKLTGLPWVADLRDPMLDAVHPADALTRRAAGWIEARAVRASARVVCTTPGAVRHYRQLFPEVPPERFCLIENGYDDEDFDAAEAAARAAPAKAAGRPLVMLHSGIIYPLERDPRPLFAALAGLLADGVLRPERFQLVLRAPVHEAFLHALIAEHGIGSLVTVAAPLPYRDALAEMLGADALLLLQAANCNEQVPAKLYEYLRANKPLLALTDPQGDTWAAVRAAGIDTLAPLDDAAQIAAALARFVALAETGSAPLAPQAVRRSHARSARTVQLAALFDAVAGEAATTVAARQTAKSSKAP